MWRRPRRRVGSFRSTATRSIIAADRDWDWAAARATCLREARRVLGPSPDVEDAAQEAALRAWINRAACGDRRDAWLATIGRREALRLVTARRPLPLDDAPEPAEPSHEDDALERVDVRRAVARLEERDRPLVFGRYWRDMTQDEVARLLDTPEGTAKVRLHRARARMRRALSDH